MNCVKESIVVNFSFFNIGSVYTQSVVTEISYLVNSTSIKYGVMVYQKCF